MKKTMIGLLAFASTSAFAFGGNDMYAMGGIASDDGDIGAQFTFGTHIMQSQNWALESTVWIMSLDDDYHYEDVNGKKSSAHFEGDYLTFTLAPVYKHHFNESFSIYGKVGAAYTNSKFKSKFIDEDGVTNNKSSKNKWGVTYGFGGEYKTAQPVFGNSHFIARGGIDWYDYSSDNAFQLATDAVFNFQAGFTF